MSDLLAFGWLLGTMEEDRRRKSSGGGGGGRARIRFGRTGPRGRMYANGGKASTGSTVVVKSSYVRAGKDSRRHISAHLRYIEERERGDKEKEREFFDRGRGGIKRDEVERAMLSNRGERAAMHKLILSPGDNAVNIQQYTRTSMDALEDRLGHRLDWYAVIHENTEHHHAHVVIAGKIPDRERELERREAHEEAAWLSGITDRMLREEKESLRSLFDPDREEPEVDERDRDVVPERVTSPSEVRWNKFLDRYEKEMIERERAEERGDVYLDRHDLRELRAAGNDYVHRERSLDRAWERAFEREFAPELDRQREREIDLDRDTWSKISSFFDWNRHAEKDRDRDDDERRRDDRDRGDDFGR